MTISPRALVAVGALVGVLVVAGVLVSVVAPRWPGSDPTVPADSALAAQCDDVPASAERLTATADDGFRLGGATVGDPGAGTVVVLRHGAGQTICDWLPWASSLAEDAGVRVILFDRRGAGASPGEADASSEPDDLVAIVRQARREGASRVALVASSMGSSVMFTALPRIPSPCAVVAISPVLTSSGLDGHAGLASAPPAATWVAWESQSSGVAADAAEIRAAGSAGPAQLLEVDTDAHSIGLVRRHPEVEAFVQEAVRACAPRP